MTETEVKASFDRTVKDHEHLRVLLMDLRGYLEVERPEVGTTGFHTWAAELSQRVASLHDKVFRHFRTEQEEGVLEELSARHPGASGRIEKLELEHEEILEHIRNLMSATLRYSEGKTLRDPRLRTRVLGLIEKLDRHERTETELINSVLYMDLGRE